MNRRYRTSKAEQVLFGPDNFDAGVFGGRENDRRLCGWYGRLAVSRLCQDPRAADSVLTWLFNHKDELALKFPDYILTFWEADEYERKKFSINKKQKILRAARRSLAPYARKPPIRIDAIGRNIRLLARELGLSQMEEALLCMRLRCSQIPGLDRLADGMIKELSCISATTSYLLGIGQAQAHRLLLPHETLTQAGFISLDLEQNYYANCVNIPRRLGRVLTRPLHSLREIQEGIIGKACIPSLKWQDFDHLSAERDFAADVLAGALKEREAGVNILLYGPPGTGKTELCKTLAMKIRASIFSVAETDDDGDEPRRGERLSQLRLVQRLLRKSKKSLVLFDEMEDLQQGDQRFGAGSGGSKIFMNRLLEGNATPTIWTANSLDGFDRALLRRFTAVMEIPLPGRHVRQRIWTKLAREAGIKVENTELKRLAAEVKAAPGVVANAVDAARLAGGGADQLRYAVHSMAKAMSGGKPVRPLQYESEIFLPGLVACDVDLGALTKRLCSAGRGFSLCLYGPPGTGKSMYARHLAKQLHMEIEQKRASDLMSMYVGGTEKNIARAFEEARTAGTFLIFDEADSLLGDRRSARASWEISQVNEMLTWMESHDLPFVCTTNLSEKLDQASLRRFTFKLQFGPLTDERLAATFKHFFGADAPSELLAIHNLTPGDFAVVKRRAGFTGELDDMKSLVKLLKSESQMKEAISRPIGFGSAL